MFLHDLFLWQCILNDPYYLSPEEISPGIYGLCRHDSLQKLFCWKRESNCVLALLMAPKWAIISLFFSEEYYCLHVQCLHLDFFFLWLENLLIAKWTGMKLEGTFLYLSSDQQSPFNWSPPSTKSLIIPTCLGSILLAH